MTIDKVPNFKLKTTLAVIVGIFYMSNEAYADFLGLPMYRPDPTTYDLVSSSCNLSISAHENDVVFSLSAGPIVLRSGQRAQEIDGETYYETYVIAVIKAGEARCLRVFYTRGEPLFGSILRTDASLDAETMVLHVPGMPSERVEITKDGNFIPILFD